MKSRPCELCGGPATLHCASDAAFLCRSCDANVHSANFLVARHVRTPICPTCHRANHARRFSGAGLVSPSSSCLTSDGTDDRVLEAVAEWRSGGGRRREALRRLGVPARVILAADGRLRGRLRRRHVEKEVEVEEGWGECGFSPKR